MKFKIFLILFFFLTFALIGRPFFVFTLETAGNKEEIDNLNKEIIEKREKIKQIEESIAEYKKKIEKKRTEAVSLSNQISILDNYLIQIELDVEATEEQVEALNLEIEALNLEISDKEAVINKQKVILKELIRTLYYEDQKKYIEVMAAYKNFSDFYNRVQFLNKIESDLGKSAKTVRLAKEELEQKNKVAAERKLAYEELKQKLINRKKDLDEQIFLKQNTLAQAQSSELTYKTMINNLKKQYQQIESEVESIEQKVRKKLEKENKLNNLEENNVNLSWPTQSRYITSYFHDPDYPYRNIFEHAGIDIRASQGTALKASVSGYVARAKHCSTSGCYSYVMLVHSSGISTLYGHLSSVNVIEDQFVSRGDIIGYSGGTPGTVGAGPFVTGAHLHFEVRKDGIPVNPLAYLIKDY